MNTLDWSSFTRRIAVDAGEEQLLAAWMTRAQIESWFLKQAAFSANGRLRPDNEQIQVGDVYEWMWHGSETVAEGEVLDIKSDGLSFSFLGCRVDVQIIRDAGETLVELIQSEIPIDDESKMGYYVECTRGWTFYLANLKSILEGGVDLRNRNDGLARVINT